MTREEMIAACEEAISYGEPHRIEFMVRPGRKPPGFPRGELMNEKVVDGERFQVRLYNARRMLDWLNRPDVIASSNRGKWHDGDG